MKIENSYGIPKTWSPLSELIKKKKNEQKIMLENEKENEQILENENNENNDLKIYVLTWNIHGRTPKKEHLKIILPKDKNYNMFIINTQECMKTIGASFVNDSKDEWVKILKEYFDTSYINLVNENLSAYHISIFVDVNIKNKFTNFQTSKIKTGFLNLMANKGAVAISMVYKKKKLCFINCHLHHGQDNSISRNEDFKRINQELNFTPYENNENILIINNLNKTDYFDIVFWSGDFNYVLNGKKEEIIKLIEEKNYFELTKFDQLNEEIKSNRIEINDFEEGEINFCPTYKFKDETDEYELENRVPGYNDRILYKVKNIHDLSLCEYNCIKEIKYSDHKPVYAVFDLKYSETQFTKCKRQDQKACFIF